MRGNSEDGKQANELLESWKEIAAFFQRGVTTVQRWEREEGLPVHRHGHGKQASVYALRSELEDWRAGRSAAPPVTPPPVAPPPVSRKVRWRIALAGILVLVAMGIARIPRRAVVYASLPLTAFPGRESYPALSPDGSDVVFAWDANRPGPTDLYIRRSSGRLERITFSESAETAPAWSPDGKFIAFLRATGDGWHLAVMNLAAGSEETLASIAHVYPIQSEMQSLAWTPDSKRVLFSEPNAGQLCIVSVGIGNRQRRVMTVPPRGAVGDVHPAIEPVSGRLAFARYRTGSEADVYFATDPGDVAQRLTHDATFIRGVAWLSKNELVISSARHGTFALWRTALDGGEMTSLAQAAPAHAVNPSTSVSGRIAYQYETRDVNLWTTSADALSAPVAPSTWTETSPDFSPDGKRIAFSSNRSGYREIWIAEADGTNPLQLTAFQVSHTDSARWSPDGRLIVLSSHSDGNRDIYLIPSSGGTARRVTTEPSEEGRPSWSRDGRTLYFRSDRSGRREIWSMPAEGGPATQITRQGGYEAFEWFDGKTLLFVKERTHPGLWAIPKAGGEAKLVAKGVREGLWTVARGGAYFLDAATNAVRELRPPAWRGAGAFRLGEGPRVFWSGLAVHPDGGSVVWSQQDASASDILRLDSAR